MPTYSLDYITAFIRNIELKFNIVGNPHSITDYANKITYSDLKSPYPKHKMNPRTTRFHSHTIFRQQRDLSNKFSAPISMDRNTNLFLRLKGSIITAQKTYSGAAAVPSILDTTRPIFGREPCSKKEKIDVTKLQKDIHFCLINYVRPEDETYQYLITNGLFKVDPIINIIIAKDLFNILDVVPRYQAEIINFLLVPEVYYPTASCELSQDTYQLLVDTLSISFIRETITPRHLEDIRLELLLKYGRARSGSNLCH